MRISSGTTSRGREILILSFMIIRYEVKVEKRIEGGLEVTNAGSGYGWHWVWRFVGIGHVACVASSGRIGVGIIQRVFVSRL
jgi:hypothetical protein